MSSDLKSKYQKWITFVITYQYDWYCSRFLQENLVVVLWRSHTLIKEMIQHFWNVRTQKTNKTIKHVVTKQSSTFSNTSAVSAPKGKFIPMEFILPRWVSFQLSITRTAQSDQNTAAKPRPPSFAETHVEQNKTLPRHDLCRHSSVNK